MNQMQGSISNLANAAAVVALVSGGNIDQLNTDTHSGGTENNNVNAASINNNQNTTNSNNLIDIQLSEGKLS